MQRSILISRAAVVGLVVAGLVATSGCSWFRKTDDLYKQSGQSRPLEVPPDLNAPRTDGALVAPGGSVTASGTAAGGASGTRAPANASAMSANGFTVASNRDETFNKVGDLLASIEGLEIASRAQLLGAYDVKYQGSNFLVRVSEAEAGAYVSAVDPRGMPAAGDAPAQLIGSLKTALDGN